MMIFHWANANPDACFKSTIETMDYSVGANSKKQLKYWIFSERLCNWHLVGNLLRSTKETTEQCVKYV